jgi:hypothetical protein
MSIPHLLIGRRDFLAIPQWPEPWGKPADEAVRSTCFGCHAPAKARDFVFIRYAP